ncbi:MAG TPA: TetR family transcriptional regulator C-terminal domain-containing protein [Phenylobacterium sp.]|uniref:TetR/AcrR family transcriptional regulator n=1 Tax=Phenylobacterium sp. TaxID=1871053 RepID=UPI002B64A265|nr:TetR family transcriptional regulator C-terminal domain-containing protein [Phenylobacterium sp.]HSV02648.1 TetR family transcriptional regulator C-terminal domain-containing protein [Phenylobacterium sp.]
MARAVDHAERREIFAAAALRVIMREGVAGLTVRAVAAEAGFTTGALTHYFNSKDQLLIEASELSARLVRERMERAERVRPALEAVRRVVALALPLTAETRGYWRIWLAYWERSSYDDEVARVMRLRYDEWRGRLERVLRRAQSEAAVAPEVDAREAAEALIALVDGIGVQVVLGVSRISAARQRAMFDAWLDKVRSGRAPTHGLRRSA